MKYLLVLLVVVIAFGIWRSKRRAVAAATAHPRPAPALKNPQAMVACAHCGLHLPLADAVTSTSGHVFCSAEHQRLGPQSTASH